LRPSRTFTVRKSQLLRMALARRILLLQSDEYIQRTVKRAEQFTDELETLALGPIIRVNLPDIK
jgi:hypothetical protein